MKTSQYPHVSQVPGQSYKLSAHHVLRTAAHLLPAHFVHGGPRDLAETRSCGSSGKWHQASPCHWDSQLALASLLSHLHLRLLLILPQEFLPVFSRLNFLWIMSPETSSVPLLGRCLFGGKLRKFWLSQSSELGITKVTNWPKQPKWGVSKKRCLHIHMSMSIYASSRLPDLTLATSKEVSLLERFNAAFHAAKGHSLALGVVATSSLAIKCCHIWSDLSGNTW